MQETFSFRESLQKEANAQAMNEYKNAENSKNYKIATQKAQAEHDKKTLEGKTFKMTAKAGQGGRTFRQRNFKAGCRRNQKAVQH